MNITLLLIGIVVYLALSFVIGLWRTKGTNLAGFIASKDSIGFWPILLSLVATIVGGGMFFAVGQIGFEAGVLGYIMGACYIVGFSLVALAIPKIRNFFKGQNYLTLIDLVDNKYKSKRTTIAFGIVNFFIYFFMLAAQFLVLGTFLNYFSGIGLSYSVLFIAIIVAVFNILIYSAVGGIRKDIATDVFQMIVIIVGSLLLLSLLIKPGVWDSISTLPNIYFTGLGYGVVMLIGVAIFFIPAFFVRLDFWQRILAAKNDKVAKKAFFIAGFLTFLFYFIFTTIGMYAKSLGIAEGKIATIGLITHTFSGLSYIVIILAFLAAVMSTADTALNVAAVTFSRMFKRKSWNSYLENQTEDKRLLKFVKISAFLIGIFSVIIAFLIPNIVDLFVAAFSAILILAPATFALLFGKRPNSKAAFWSIVIGFFVFLALFIFIPKESFVAGVLISIITYFVVAKFSKKPEIISPTLIP